MTKMLIANVSYQYLDLIGHHYFYFVII